MAKRIFDVTIAALGLALFWPVLLLVAVLVKWTSPGGVLFKQERIGKGFRPFFIHKFRTMIPDAPRLGGPITLGEDPRITRIGRLLRKTKLDELPQLINVLAGEMSLVGPRPEVPRYVEMFHADYEEILQVRPGITDLASIYYRDEAAVLGRAEDSETEYVRRVLPRKIELAKQYCRRRSLLFDCRLILQTALVLCSDRFAPRRDVNEGQACRGRLRRTPP